MSRTAGTTNARDGRVVEGLRCVVCRAVGPSSFAASDSGFYVCVRCGTQTQSQVEDAAEMGLEEAEGGDVFGGGCGCGFGVVVQGVGFSGGYCGGCTFVVLLFVLLVACVSLLVFNTFFGVR